MAADAPDDRIHRVPDPQRPLGGPFGPGKKHRRQGTGRQAYPAAGQKYPPAQRRPNTPPPASPSAKKQTTDWSDVSEWYDTLVGDEGSEYHREVVLPGTLRLLGPLAGKRVLDVACGQGVLSRQLQAAGATVTGVDAAEPLLEAARQRGPAEIHYHLADAKDLKGIEDNAYDLAACLLAIQNIHPPQPVFTSVARTLKPGGTFIVVMMHPAFRSPKATHWGWEPNEMVQFRRVDKYLLPRKEPIITHPGKKTGAYTWTFHHPIGDYVKYMRNAGLLVDALEEWPSHKVSDSGPRAPAENAARKEIPMFLALRGVKMSS